MVNMKGISQARKEKTMFGIFSDMIHLATRIPPAGRGDQTRWDAPEHWRKPRQETPRVKEAEKGFD